MPPFKFSRTVSNIYSPVAHEADDADDAGRPESRHALVTNFRSRAEAGAWTALSPA
jgi:hypothetical protein